MGFDERTPRDIFAKDKTTRRPSRTEAADDLDARTIAPVAVIAPAAESPKKKKLLVAAMIVALAVSGVLLAPSSKQSRPTAPAAAGADTDQAPLPVVVAQPTTTAITSAADRGFDPALRAFLKQLSSRKGLTIQAAAAALERKFSLPVGIEKMPKPAAGGGIELSQIGAAEILVQVEDDGSRVVAFHAMALH